MEYRDHFRSASVAEKYESTEYAPLSHSSILWEVEKSQLDRIIAELALSRDRISYLDFATGTGRVLEHVAGQVTSAVGIDVSQEMVDIAKTKVAVSLCAGT